MAYECFLVVKGSESHSVFTIYGGIEGENVNE